jgi:hypothetical protein
MPEITEEARDFLQRLVVQHVDEILEDPGFLLTLEAGPQGGMDMLRRVVAGLGLDLDRLLERGTPYQRDRLKAILAGAVGVG